jgi:hypothetical protein
VLSVDDAHDGIVGRGVLLDIPALRGGPWDAARSRAGLHPQAMDYLAKRRVAALGSDGNSDTAPSAVDGVAFPVHVLAINAMGLHLLDYLQFDDVLPLCKSAGRWSFLCVIAPLRLPGGPARQSTRLPYREIAAADTRDSTVSRRVCQIAARYTG